MSELFGPLSAAGSVSAATSDTAWLQAMLDAEAALALAQADAGVLPTAQADVIAGECHADRFDAGQIGRDATGIGNPVGPVVRALTAHVAEVDTAASGAVHRGATSQDILDTGAMLVARRATDELLAELNAIARLAASLAEQHACTPQVGRSLLQQALPITFGLTAAGWLTAVESAARQLEASRAQFAVQLGGAAGTLASLGDSGSAVLAAFARRTGLSEPLLPWHTDRSRITGLAGALGTTSGVLAKIARDVTLLAQTEIGEVEEIAAGVGGSSTLPHKRNPIAAVSALAAAAQAPGLVSTLLSASTQEHQRAAGNWHAEWRPYNELLRSTGTAAYWLRTSLTRLRVHPARMRENLSVTGGLILAERVTTALAPEIGRLAAHDAVTECAHHDSANDRFDDRLLNHPVLKDHLTRERLQALLEPSGYLGSTRQFIDRALSGRPRTGAIGPVDVHFRVDGPEDGVPVLLGNSIGSDLSIWNNYVETLSESGFRVIRHDTRGHGDSPVPAGPYTIDDVGADAVALLDRLGIERAHVVGVSLGGMLGLWLAEHQPERVGSIAVCCSSAHPGNRQMWIERAAQARAEGMQRIADQSVTRWFTPGWRAANPELAHRMRGLTADTPAEGYAACCELLADLDLTPGLAAITAPTLVISGADDAALPPDHGRTIAARVPGARFETVDEAAHLGTVEQSGRFLELVLRHLGDAT